MLNAIRKVVFGAGDRPESTQPCPGCDPRILARCSEPEAGSVTPHAYHVFIKLPAPAGVDPEATGEAWWPAKLEDEVAEVNAVNDAIKAAGERILGKVKVTAFDYLPTQEQAPGTCDVLIFPQGIRFQNLPSDKLPSAVVESLADTISRRASGVGEPTAAEQAPQPSGTALYGTHMFVCCHNTRDERCGHIGPALAEQMALIVGLKGLSGGISVYKTSHIGGHKYAGNVIVFSKGKLYHGDWFGGLNAGNAPAFLEALLACKAPSGAPGDFNLRRWWRGRIGQTKEQQLECFKKAAVDIEDLTID